MMAKRDNGYRRELARLVDAEPMFDTHEHLLYEPALNSRKLDLFQSWFSQYASSDLISSGLSKEGLEAIRDPKRPVSERWQILEPFWQRMKTTGYGRALILAAHDLFGIDRIDASTVSILAEKLEAANQPGWYQYVLRGMAGISSAVVDGFDWPKPEPTPSSESAEGKLFLHARRFDDFSFLNSRVDLAALEKQIDRSIASLHDLETALEVSFCLGLSSDETVAVKSGLAYSRTLAYEKTTRTDAEAAFDRVVSRGNSLHHDGPYLPGDTEFREAKPLQDYMMYRIVSHASDSKLPVLFHTGLQEGNGNVIENSRPTSLLNLIRCFPDVRFDLFHAGYPYTAELTTLAKNFPNVYADLCWVHIISPSFARRTLREWLETVPNNKLFVFGGDYIFVEGAYAHARIARQNVASVLADAVDDEYLTEDEVRELIPALLHGNAEEFFQRRKAPGDV